MAASSEQRATHPHARATGAGTRARTRGPHPTPPDSLPTPSCLRCRPNLVGVFPEKSLKLSVNDTLRETFTRRNGDGTIRVWQEIASGGGAGLLQVAVTK